MISQQSNSDLQQFNNYLTLVHRFARYFLQVSSYVVCEVCSNKKILVQSVMASGSKSAQGKESHEIQLVNNEVKQPEFKPIPKVAYKNDSIGALFVIPDKVVMVQDMRKCYNCKIGAIGDLEIYNAFDKLCDEGIL